MKTIRGTLRFTTTFRDESKVGTPALVLGNGESRLSYLMTKSELADRSGLPIDTIEPMEWKDLVTTQPQCRAVLMEEYSKISNLGVTVIGCNAIYRHWWPDFLCSVDPKMNDEVMRSEYPKECFAFKLCQGYASGPCALAMAAHRGHNPIYLSGFDLGATPRVNNVEKPLINNVFRDTINYHKSAVLQVSPVSWIQHMVVIMDHFEESKYIQVGPPHSMKPPIPRWHGQPQCDGNVEAWLTEHMQFCTWQDMIKESQNAVTS